MATLRKENKGIYWAWKAMKQRCLNPRCAAYKNYGARGIGICDDWIAFEPFCEWALSNGYEKGLDLDRIDNDKGYDPDNCRWTTRRENINNRRRTTLITVNGRTLPRTGWEQELDLPCGIVKSWVTTRGIEYASERIAEIIENGYTPMDYGRNHVRTPIKCLDDGRSFASVYDAAKYYGLDRGHLISACKRNGKIHGLHFVYEGA